MVEREGGVDDVGLENPTAAEEGIRTKGKSRVFDSGSLWETSGAAGVDIEEDVIVTVSKINIAQRRVGDGRD